jgi:hypothetical protein
VSMVAAGIGTVGTLGSAYLSYRAAKQNNSRTNTSTGTNRTVGNQRSTYRPASQLNQAYANQIANVNKLSGTATPYFKGQTYVGPSALTKQGVSSAQQSAGLTQAGANMQAQSAGAMMPYLQTQQKNYNTLSNAADVANNQYVQNQLAANARSVSSSLANDTLPQLQQGAVGVNNLGSSRLGIAQGKAIGDASEALANTNASTMLNAYNSGLSAQQNALSQTGSMLQNVQQPGRAVQSAGNAYGTAANTLGTAGSTVEGYQQKALTDAMNRYSYQYSEPWTRVGNTQNALSGLSNLGTTYGSSNSSSTSSGTSANANYTNPLQAAIGGGMAGYGVYNQWKKNQANSQKTG